MKIALLPVLLSVIPMMGFAQESKAVRDDIQYIVMESGGPDQGPGKNVEENFKELAKRYGAMPSTSGRMLACGVQQLRILTRSAEVVRGDVVRALDLAESTGIPVFLHVDPCYGWGADGEQNAGEAPPVKYWQDKEMREWDRFPVEGHLPDHVPRVWMDWGSWCTPAPAAPAFGSAKFVKFATSQLDEGVLIPLTERLEKWRATGRGHLFAGINIAWETHFMDYAKPSLLRAVKNGGGTPRARHPESERGRRMGPNLVGRQLGYASLHWLGWDAQRIDAAARQEGITAKQKFEQLCFGVLHDYMESLAKACHQRGLPAERVYTHIVALASVGKATMSAPPISTAVNPYSTPGFTMDNRGGARFDLDTLLKRLRQAGGGPKPRFGVVETYFKLNGPDYFTDAGECLHELETMFAAGATIQVFYGGFPLEKRSNPPVLNAMQRWLDRAEAKPN